MGLYIALLNLQPGQTAVKLQIGVQNQYLWRVILGNPAAHLGSKLGAFPRKLVLSVFRSLGTTRLRKRKSHSVSGNEKHR